MNYSIYIVSKIKHADKWKALRGNGWPVISSWIFDGLETDIDFTEAWPRYLKEARLAGAMIVYTEEGEELKGGVLEIGAAMSQETPIFIVGPMPAQLRTAQACTNVYVSHSLPHALCTIQEFADPNTTRESRIGRWVEASFGRDLRHDLQERLKRTVEEALELGQTRLPREDVLALVERVYSKPVGLLTQEMAQVGVTLLALADCYGVCLDSLIQAEMDRIFAIPPEVWAERQRKKAEAGLGMMPTVVVE